MHSRYYGEPEQSRYYSLVCRGASSPGYLLYACLPGTISSLIIVPEKKINDLKWHGHRTTSDCIGAKIGWCLVIGLLSEVADYKLAPSFLIIIIKVPFKHCKIGTCLE